MRRLAAFLAIAIAPSLAFTCDPSGPDGDDLEVRFTDDGLVATNDTGATIYYAAVNPRALVLWTVCTEPATCASIPDGASVTVGFDDIVGWTGDAQAERVSFHYWRLKRAGDGYTATAVRTKSVAR